MAEQFSIPEVGDVIAGKYRVVAELGRGAYGVVFRAEQDQLGRNVAVKTLLPQAFLQKDIVERFHREAQLISLLDHRNIIRLYDYGVDEGLLYMAVEFVEGRTLMQVIETEAPLTLGRVRNLGIQILRALEHAHANGIIHRDLKPENIILLRNRPTDGRETEEVKILDFGISKLIRGDNQEGALKSLTQDGTVLGTPHYMSPENIVGDPIDHRADLYAVGVILYEMVTGVHPFDAPSPSAVMVRHLRDEHDPLPPLAEASPIGEAITRALEKQPWDRVGSAREMRELLEQPTDDIDETIVRFAPATRGDESGRPAGPQQAKDRQIPLPLIGALLLIVGVLIASIGWKVWLAADATAVAGKPEVGAAREPDLGTPVVVAVPEPVVEPDVGLATADSGMTFVVKPDAGAEEQDAGALEAPVAKPAVPKHRSKPPAVALVELDILSEPENAIVTLDGSPIGNTPTRRTVPADESVEVRFSHIGYKDHVVRLTPSGKRQTVSAKLEREQLQLTP